MGVAGAAFGVEARSTGPVCASHGTFTAQLVAQIWAGRRRQVDRMWHPGSLPGARLERRLRSMPCFSQIAELKRRAGMARYGSNRAAIVRT